MPMPNIQKSIIKTIGLSQPMNLFITLNLIKCAKMANVHIVDHILDVVHMFFIKPREFISALIANILNGIISGLFTLIVITIYIYLFHIFPIWIQWMALFFHPLVCFLAYSYITEKYNSDFASSMIINNFTRKIRFLIAFAISMYRIYLESLRIKKLANHNLE